MNYKLKIMKRAYADVWQGKESTQQPQQPRQTQKPRTIKKKLQNGMIMILEEIVGNPSELIKRIYNPQTRTTTQSERIPAHQYFGAEEPQWPTASVNYKLKIMSRIKEK